MEDIRRWIFLCKNVEKPKEAGEQFLLRMRMLTGEAILHVLICIMNYIKRIWSVPLIDKCRNDDYADDGGPVLCSSSLIQSYTLEICIEWVHCLAATLSATSGSCILYKVEQQPRWSQKLHFMQLLYNQRNVIGILAPLAGESCHSETGGWNETSADAVHSIKVMKHLSPL